MSESALSREPVPKFTLADVSGRQVSLDDYLGKKAVVLNFTALFMSECEHTDELLQLIRRDYSDVVILSIFGQLEDLRFPDAPSQLYQKRRADALLVDSNHTVINAYRMTVVPTLVLIDLDGRMRYCGRDAFAMEDVLKKFARKR